ncbi:phage tail tape measure protein [Brevibacillus sp. HD3.3A]|uniref:phage tail tape measure protein n=1 Tax=Brevibacillus sp. HD3.3A TaxID=2738979 RepID=UPI001E46235D|nr:phage tail tape measure protein [Brevibacillus sp. HD3.3A]UED72158.1 phage tail tape measure protein [Brevibacillus sp. HD3.3A]
MSTILDIAIALSLSDRVTNGVNNIISQFRLMNGATEEAQRRMDSFKNMAWTGGAFAAGGALAFAAVTKTASEALERAGNLQEVMTEIKSLTFGKDLFDPTKADEISGKMRIIENLATRLGLETTFSNIDAGQAIVELQKGGIKYQDIVNGAAEATIKFAQLNKMAPTAAAELMVQTRAGFQLIGEQMLGAADIVTKVAATSSANAADINRGLGNMAGVATQMWGTRNKYEQVLDSSALVALTRTQTPEGASAGTFVRNFLERLVPQTKRQTEMMDSVGWLDAQGKSVFLDYSKDPRGQLKSALEIAKILRKTVGAGMVITNEKDIEKQFELAQQGMGTDKLIKLFHKVFGEQGGRTAYTLLRTGEGSLEEIMSGVDDQLSLTERVRFQMENYNQVLDTAREAWNTFLSALGSPLLGAATKFFAYLNDQLSRAAIFFQEHPQVSRYMFAVAGGVSAFVALTGIVLVSIAAFGALRTALEVAGIGFGRVFALSGLAALAIAGIGTAIYLIYEHWDDIVPYAEAVWSGVKEAAEPSIKWYQANVAPVFRAVTDEAVHQLERLEGWLSANKTRIEQFFGFSRKQMSDGNDPEAFEVLEWKMPEWMQPVITAGEKMIAVGKAISDNWSTIEPIVGAAAAAVLAYKGYIIATEIVTKTITLATKAWALTLALVNNATKIWALAQWALNAAMAANPIGLVVAGVAALIIGGYLLFKNWDDISKKTVELWDNMGALKYALLALPFVNIFVSSAQLYQKWDEIVLVTKKAKITIEEFGYKGLLFIADLIKSRVMPIVTALLKAFDTIAGTNYASQLQNQFDAMVDSAEKSLKRLTDQKYRIEIEQQVLEVKNSNLTGEEKARVIRDLRINGSHFNGLPYVPFDGYIAELHKGEMVLTSQEANKVRRNNYETGRAVMPTSNSGGGLILQNGASLVSIGTIQQQPGEDADALANRIADKAHRKVLAALKTSGKMGRLTIGTIGGGI